MNRFIENRWLRYEGKFKFLCEEKGLRGDSVKPIYRLGTKSHTAATWSGEKEDFFDQSEHPASKYGLVQSGGFALFHRYQEYSAFLIETRQRKRLSAYEKRAYIAYLAYDLYRAANNTGLLQFLTDVLEEVDLSEYLKDIDKQEGADLGLPQVFGGADRKLMVAIKAFIQIQKKKTPGYFSVERIPSEYFRDFITKYFQMAWNFSGAEAKWKNCLPGVASDSLRRNAWEEFQPHALELMEQEHVRFPSRLLEGACDEIRWFLAESKRREIALETQDQLNRELIIQGRYLHVFNQAANNAKSWGGEASFLKNVLPPLRLCKYCGDVFTQSRGYKISHRCCKHTCKNVQDREYMQDRRKRERYFTEDAFWQKLRRAWPDGMVGDPGINDTEIYHDDNRNYFVPALDALGDPYWKQVSNYDEATVTKQYMNKLIQKWRLSHSDIPAL
ncbi:MAG: hypothetical protein ACYCXE_05030 [Thermoleophilia bacterium]